MKLIHFDEIDSTNAYIAREVNSLSNFSIVEASYQTAGKGRENRTWISPKDENLMFSILIKDKKIIEEYKCLSIMMANIIRNLLTNLEIENVNIKWPNDVYVNDKKICGILLQGQYPNYLIIGIGINVNQIEFSGEYKTSPTSIRLETGSMIDFDLFKADLYETLINELKFFEDAKEGLIDEVREHNYLLNKETKYGKVVDIDDDFALVTEKDNKQVKISTGEVDLIGK